MLPCTKTGNMESTVHITRNVVRKYSANDF